MTTTKPMTNTHSVAAHVNDQKNNHNHAPARPVSKRSMLKQQLNDEIRRRMPVLPQNANPTKAEVVESYVRSLQTLQSMQEEVQELISPLCAANLSFRQTETHVYKNIRDEVLAEAHRHMIATIPFEIPRPSNAIDAEVLALKTSELLGWLRESVDTNLTNFVDGFFQMLDDLVDQSAAGLAIWTSPTTVQYSYVRQLVEHRQTGTTSETYVAHRDDSPSGLVERTETTVSGTDTHYLARHEHHVFDACECPLEQATVLIPLSVQNYIENIPEWLRPIHRIIEGTIGDKSVMEKKYRIDEWDETTTRDVFIYGQDPAVAIGDVVLIGWDSEDIKTEETRRQRLAESKIAAAELQRAQRLSPLWAIITALLSLTSLVLFYSPSSQLQFWAACAALLTCVPTLILHTTFSDHTGVTNTVHVAAALGTVSVLFAAGLLLAFGVAFWSCIATSLCLLIVGIVAIAFSQTSN